ncbi:MAG: GAF domain-containing protein [Bryobacteraceae bacterium]
MHLPIQDQKAGLILEGGPAAFDNVAPGDWVEARGKIAQRGGLAVLQVTKLTTQTSGAPPIALAARPEQLRSFLLLGQLVRTGGTVIEAGRNGGGAYLQLGNAEDPLKIFLPDVPGTPPANFTALRVGDQVQVTGISYQYCAAPPFDRYFEVLVRDRGDVTRIAPGIGSQIWTARRWLLLAAVSLVAWLWWTRRARAQRQMLRSMYRLGEDVLGATSYADILSRIDREVPRAMRVSSVRLYLFDRETRALDVVVAENGPGRASAAIDAPSGLIETAAVTCFQNRTLLSLADTRRSPFPCSEKERESGLLPRSLLFVPMLAQGEAAGVFQIASMRAVRSFNPDEEAVSQHLANQMALAVKLLQQRSFREQLSRSEKLAAVGRLISGVVNDLQTPLEAVSSMAESALEQYPNSPAAHELLVIASEAKRASAIVERLVSFAQPEHAQAEPADVSVILQSLIRFREREWKACGIQLKSHLKDEPLFVLGAYGQLEQVFLNLLVHAEQSLEEVNEKCITVRADVLARKVFIEIGYNAPGKTPNRSTGAVEQGEGSALGLDVCRSIMAGHGGEMRMVHSARESTFEVELPWLANGQPAAEQMLVEPRQTSKRWTALLLEPEEWMERRMVESLANRGYRVVPVRSSEEGLDLVQRLRFDVVFCSTNPRGLNWVEFFDRVRGRVGAFTLLAEAFSHDLSIHFRGEGRFVLHKPIDAGQFEQTLDAIETRLQTSEVKSREVELY